jgi:hypothetical protein
MEAIEQLRLYFAPLRTRQGIVGREVLGTPAPDDGTLKRDLLQAMQADCRDDGSFAGGVVGMVWRAHELLDLNAADEPQFTQIMGGLVDLQGRPGAFSEGCTPARHSYHACEHFISGFFSPAPPQQRIAPLMLPNGKVFRAEPAARFAVSCLALRAALRGGLAERQSVDRHVVSLIHLQKQKPERNGYFAADVIVAGLHALAYVTGARRREVPELTALIPMKESEESQESTDLFHTMEALLAIGTPEARAVLRQLTPALLARQRADGSFGPTAQQERALIALKALIWVEQEG